MRRRRDRSRDSGCALGISARPGSALADPGLAPKRQGEALVVWFLIGLLLVAIFVTYWRLPAADLYNTSVEGIRGGAGRVLVQTNFPSVSLVAIALVLVAVSALPARAWWIAAPSIAMCLVTAWPGQVKQSDLDARAVNLLPALGVALALGLTAWATRRAGARFAPRLPGDRARIVAAVVIVLVSIPWITAELGFFIGNRVFLTSRVVTEGDETLPAVHLGHHHGLDGALLMLFALVLSRVRIPDTRLGSRLLAYVSLMFAYGFMNFAEDAWHEQLVKRGWLEWRIPSALLPRLHWIWLVTLGVALLTYALFAVEHRRVQTAIIDGHERSPDGLSRVREVRAR
jgi:hypothetical protein